MQIDRFNVGSFDRASLSPLDYAALKSRIARQAQAERAKAIRAALAWLVAGVVQLCRNAVKRPAPKATNKSARQARAA
jgi:hypothetical protein